MKRMTMLKNQERRITSIEEVLASHTEILAAHSDSLYQLKRDSIENRIGMHLLLDHFGLPRVTPEQVDEVLDAE